MDANPRKLAITGVDDGRRWLREKERERRKRTHAEVQRGGNARNAAWSVIAGSRTRAERFARAGKAYTRSESLGTALIAFIGDRSCREQSGRESLTVIGRCRPFLRRCPVEAAGPVRYEQFIGGYIRSWCWSGHPFPCYERNRGDEGTKGKR